MSNKGMIIRECEQLNTARRVFEGRVDSRQFFRTIQGDLLLSGDEAGNTGMIVDLACSCLEKQDIPTILLSSHLEVILALQAKRNAGKIERVMTSSPLEQNFHPFYGMSAQQIMRFICMTAEEMGYGTLTDQVMIYTAAILNIVSVKYPVSLPAMTNLLAEDDDTISGLALQWGLSNVVSDNIRAHHAAGIALRRLCERLEEVFEEVYTRGSDTKYNFRSGAKGNVNLMAFYACSSNQRMLNSYLKEEIYHVLKGTAKIRVILDEMTYENENDELLKYLLQAKRQGKIELVLLSKNIRESLHSASDFDFSNVVMFQQATPAATDEMSRDLFGTFQYHFPVPVAGNTPHMVFSLQKVVHWQIQTEERLRIRSLDLYGRQSFFGIQSDYLAVKTSANNNIYLIHTSDFLPVESTYPRVI